MRTPLVFLGPLNSIIVDLNKPYIIRSGKELDSENNTLHCHQQPAPSLFFPQIFAYLIGIFHL